MKTHAWDFALSEGVTKKEKFSHLYNLLCKFFERDFGSGLEAFLIGGEKLLINLVLCANKDEIYPVDLPEKKGRKFVGLIKKVSPVEQKVTTFKIYQDRQLTDKLLLTIGDNSIELKIYNLP